MRAPRPTEIWVYAFVGRPALRPPRGGKVS
nr:MAG TPA: hypothetical protein [Bacteriophage sp.]